MNRDLRRLCQYFVIAYGFSWIVWTPFILDSRKIIELPPSLLPVFGPVGTFGPFVGAFLLSYRDNGKNGIVALAKRGFSWRFNKVWWVPTLLFWPGLQAIALVLAVVFAGEALPEVMFLSQPWLLLPVFLRGLFVGGAFGEEFGWRGYALDRLQANWNALVASLVLGLLHACWHIPLWFAVGPKARTQNFGLFAFNVVVVAIVYTWLYNNTGRSILPSLVFHTLSNMMIFPVHLTQIGYPIWGLMIWGSTLVIVVIFKPRRLVRGDKSVNLLNRDRIPHNVGTD
jgi:membrane protease YdiL (CAAX protease family)